MKRLAALITVMVFMSGMAGLGFAETTEKCDRCHKGRRPLTSSCPLEDRN
jgi:hypothetical protein